MWTLPNFPAIGSFVPPILESRGKAHGKDARWSMIYFYFEELGQGQYPTTGSSKANVGHGLEERAAVIQTRRVHSSESV